MLEYFRSALISIWSNKVRSVLNILGVVIGISSVTILVSLGEGLKEDMSSLIQGLGTNVMSITGGKLDTNSMQQGGANPADFIAGNVLTMDDIRLLEGHPDIEAVSPINIVSGTLKYGDKTSPTAVYGTFPTFLEASGIVDLDKGKMFDRRDSGDVVVLGKNATEALFGEEDPVGKKVALGDRELEIIGTVKSSRQESVIGSEFDAFSLIPFDTATSLSKGEEKVLRIMTKAKEDVDVKAVKADLEKQMLAARNGEDNFTILTQDDMLGLFNTFLNLATTMVSAIAAISLVVGGIGIMNIMLVTVTERTREIGLRKAIGATKLAILSQFLIEAIVVTFVGALLGLAIAFAAAAIIAANTDLNPAITPSIIALAVGISVGIGVLFGLWPAMRAAQKDPIEALRYE